MSGLGLLIITELDRETSMHNSSLSPHSTGRVWGEAKFEAQVVECGECVYKILGLEMFGTDFVKITVK